MNKEEYHYENNMHIIDHVLNELKLTRICQEVEDFEKAKTITYLKIFPCANPKAEIIEGIFNEYCNDYCVSEWYNTTFIVPITKRFV